MRVLELYLMYICNICGNTNINQLISIEDVVRCRMCLRYLLPSAILNPVVNRNHKLHLNFQLTALQSQTARQIKNQIQNKQNTLIYAICGAGKTEIVAQSIIMILNGGGRVGFATPRRALAIDIQKRFVSMFPLTKVIAVYGQHHDVVDGELIVFTTHQSMRYQKVFDLLIIDEVDAFPYQGNRTLNTITERTARGPIVKLTATPTTEDIKENVTYQLFQRPHKHRQILPVYSSGLRIVRLYVLLTTVKRWQKQGHSILIFAPTIQTVNWIAKTISRFVSPCYAISSMTPHTKELYHHLTSHTPLIATTTTIMERGLTIPNVNVFVWDADHPVFTMATLIQIVGRVGRVAPHFEGEAILCGKRETKEIMQCMKTIEQQNRFAPNVENTI